MTRNKYPIYEGEMQSRIEAALEHLSQAWGAARRAGIDTSDPREWPPEARNYIKFKHDEPEKHMLYSLAAATDYVYEVFQGMRQQWGSNEGQLCPYQDCCYNLALPQEGWYTCGKCLRDFWCRESDGIEDYHCYRPGSVQQEPPKPESIPVARILGKSWASPDEQEAEKKDPNA